MSKRLIGIALILIALPLVLVACEETGDTNQDTAAAQQFIPSPSGYAEHETDNIQDAIATTLGGAGALTGNIPQAAIVAQINNMVNCYREVGAFDAKMHIQNVTLSDMQTPVAGVVAVVNADRVTSNFVSCANPANNTRSQSASLVNPCFDSGTFEAEGDTFLYFYGATDAPLCLAYGAHFGQYTSS